MILQIMHRKTSNNCFNLEHSIRAMKRIYLEVRIVRNDEDGNRLQYDKT